MRGQTPIQRDGTKRLADSETQPQPLESLLSKNRFPNRSSLRIHEVADALQLTFGHVANLVQEYRDTGGESGLPALNLSTGNGSQTGTGRNPTGRGCWRIAVSDYDKFLRKRLGL